MFTMQTHLNDMLILSKATQVGMSTSPIVFYLLASTSAFSVADAFISRFNYLQRDSFYSAFFSSVGCFYTLIETEAF